MHICKKCNKKHNGKFGSGIFCSRACANSRIRTAELRKRVSIILKNNVPWNKGNKTFVQVVCVTCKKEFKTKSWPKRKTCSKYCYLHAPGKGGFRINSTRKIRSEYKGYWMDSGAERKFAELLDDNKIEWIKNSKQWFQYFDKEGKSRKYYPDFYLPEYNVYLDPKKMIF